jgi:hypothetical protein
MFRVWHVYQEWNELFNSWLSRMTMGERGYYFTRIVDHRMALSD